MRILIKYLAIISVMLMIVVFQSDYLQIEIEEATLKNDIQDTVKCAVMEIDKEKYSDGYIYFDDNKILEIVDQMLYDTQKCTEFNILLFDHTGKLRQLDKKGLVLEKNFDFPYVYVDSKGYETVIEYPCIIIQAEIDREFYHLSELKNNKENISRSVMYVVEGR